MKITKIALFSCIAAPACITPQIITSAILDSFNSEDKDEIPEKFYKIEDGKLLGFKDNIRQSDLHVGHYTIMNIPLDVTEISDYAFAYMFDGVGCDVSTLIIPQKLKKIGNYSFFRCSGLTQIVFRSVGKDSCSLQSIGAHSFEYCSFTGDLVLPNLLEEIGDRAFYNCKSLNQSLVLPSSLNKVGNFAFASCSSIHTIDLTNYDDVPTWMYSYKSAFQSVGVDVSGIKHVIVNTELDAIDIWNDVLMTRQELKSDVATMQFSIVSTETYRPIPEYKLNIEEGTEGEEIGLMVLRGWKSGEEVDLSKYNVLSIPASVNKIGDSAFVEKKGDLPSIVLPGKLINCELTLEIQGNMLQIGQFGFCNCTGLVGVADWTKVTDIDVGAFYGCSNLKGNLNTEASTISEFAFCGCSSLSQITLTPSTIDILALAFEGCDGVHILDLQGYTDASTLPTQWLEDHNVPFLDWDTTGIILLNPDDTRKDKWIDLLSDAGLSIDSDHWGIINDESVENLDEYIAYSHNSQLVRGFSNLGLNKITEFNTLSFLNRAETINDYAFQNLLTKTKYPNNEWTLHLNLGLQTIGKGAFKNDTGLRALFSWPNSLTTIDNEAFYGCSNLRGELILSRSLSYLGDGAFNGCKHLTAKRLIIPSSINYIGSNALKSVHVINLKLKKFVGSIGSNAFDGNSSLAWIDLTDYDAIPDEDEWQLSSNAFKVSGEGSVIVNSETSKDDWKEYLVEHGLPDSKWEVIYPNEIEEV